MSTLCLPLSLKLSPCVVKFYQEIRTMENRRTLVCEFCILGQFKPDGRSEHPEIQDKRSTVNSGALVIRRENLPISWRVRERQRQKHGEWERAVFLVPVNIWKTSLIEILNKLIWQCLWWHLISDFHISSFVGSWSLTVNCDRRGSVMANHDVCSPSDPW